MCGTSSVGEQLACSGQRLGHGHGEGTWTGGERPPGELGVTGLVLHQQDVKRFGAHVALQYPVPIPDPARPAPGQPGRSPSSDAIITRTRSKTLKDTAGARRGARSGGTSGAEAGFVPAESTLLDPILEPGRLAVVFQPIFHVGNGVPNLHAVESLIRGPRSTNAERPAVLFEYVRRKRAEAVVDRACIGAVLSQGRSLPHSTLLSMNVHASTLGRDAGFPPSSSSGPAPPGRTRRPDRRNRRALAAPRRPELPWRAGGAARGGRPIALDDVGLGQSNYKMILDVRPDIYKLDRYLVSGAWNDRYRQVILDSLARMVRRLEARAVAEGVETSEELEAVRAAGIDLVQGFYFSRPLTYEDLAQTGYLAGCFPGGPGVSDLPRVLVLDDDPKVQQLLRTYFGGLGWSVQSCGDPANAMAIADSDQPFDAVICDLHFTPGRNAEGLELIERARHRRPAAAVLLFTAADGPLRKEALARGADRCHQAIVADGLA